MLMRAKSAHCLDTLRQAVMCQGDASPMTMKWGTMQPVPLANFDSPHECVDWNALDAWAEGRRVNVYEPGLVVHPQLGTYWPRQEDDAPDRATSC
jgi:hypothetical protein